MITKGQKTIKNRIYSLLLWRTEKNQSFWVCLWKLFLNIEGLKLLRLEKEDLMQLSVEQSQKLTWIILECDKWHKFVWTDWKIREANVIKGNCLYVNKRLEVPKSNLVHEEIFFKVKLFCVTLKSWTRFRKSSMAHWDSFARRGKRVGKSNKSKLYLLLKIITFCFFFNRSEFISSVAKQFPVLPCSFFLA